MRPRNEAERRRMISEAREKCRERAQGCTPYITVENGIVDEIGCRLCNRPVAKLGDVGKPLERRTRPDGVVEVTRRVTLRRLPERQAIRIAFDDGSAHETEVCASCAKGLTTDQLEAIYCRDLCQMAHDEATDGVECPWHAFADRKPTGYQILSG